MSYFRILLLITFIPGTLLGQGFDNVATNLGLDYSYQSEDYGGGVSFVDFNQDGLDDLSFATHEGLTPLFFLNTGNGFSAPLNLIDNTDAIKQLLWIDYNNDKLLDLYISSSNQNKLYKNTGNLEMVDITEESGLTFPNLESYCSTWFDYDNDGRLDLLVAHRTEDRDGSIDIYRNIDNDTFEKMTAVTGLQDKGQSVLAMTTFDFNNDGWQDIFLAQDWEKGNQLFKNNGNGTFSDVSRSSGVNLKMNSMSATIMDINHDGWLDLYVTNTSLGTALLVNDGHEKFEEKSAYYNLDLGSVTFGAVFFDADNDSDDDLHIGGFLANYTFEDLNENEEFKRRDNDWGFQFDGDFNNGVAIGDFNNDGYVDIVKNSVTRGNLYVSNNSLWQNNFNQNNYIKIKLKGTISNSYAIGAKISVHTASKTQHKRLGCGESFSSQHSLHQHFGLGQDALIDSIVIRWPSRNVTVIDNVPSNQSIIIEEPLEGCTDIEACNYNPLAQTDSGYCRYSNEHYDCFGCIEDMDQDGVCDQLEILGCTEYDACNYSESATENDGSCFYIPSLNIEGPSHPAALEEVKYLYPETSGSRYEWTITNGSILSGHGTNSITVVWYEVENGHLTVKETNASECVGNLVNREIEISPRVYSSATAITVGPNPSAGFLDVYNISSPSVYHIYNTQGQMIHTGEVTLEKMQIDISSLSLGLYVVEIFVGDRNEKFKIIKQ